MHNPESGSMGRFLNDQLLVHLDLRSTWWGCTKLRGQDIVRKNILTNKNCKMYGARYLNISIITGHLNL